MDKGYKDNDLQSFLDYCLRMAATAEPAPEPEPVSAEQAAWNEEVGGFLSSVFAASFAEKGE